MPFYGESSFLMYRKDLFEQAGITLSDPPTWTEVAEAAAQLDSPDINGICLRGKPGWGELLAPLDTVINTFGGRWFDENWNAQLNSPEVREAVQFYVDLVREYGQPGAATSGFSECATQLAQGRVAMWYDSTPPSRPRGSRVEQRRREDRLRGRARPGEGPLGLALHLVARHPREQRTHRGRLEVHLVDDRPAVPAHRRRATRLGAGAAGQPTVDLRDPRIRRAAAAYGPITLESIEGADQQNPTVDPVPYTGIQFVAIPEFQDLGTRVSQQISAAIAGRQSVEDALDQAQKYAEAVGATYREKTS